MLFPPFTMQQCSQNKEGLQPMGQYAIISSPAHRASTSRPPSGECACSADTSSTTSACRPRPASHRTAASICRKKSLPWHLPAMSTPSRTASKRFCLASSGAWWRNQQPRASGQSRSPPRRNRGQASASGRAASVSLRASTQACSFSKAPAPAPCCSSPSRVAAASRAEASGGSGGRPSGRPQPEQPRSRASPAAASSVCQALPAPKCRRSRPQSAVPRGPATRRAAARLSRKPTASPRPPFMTVSTRL
mmetsp:Transcript_30407/g.50317  ORF Transcript_30407/g.50317 Transcript_30407/m.50317 type:complete len:249 (+) Transcript_30407:436-1182(+)